MKRRCGRRLSHFKIGLTITFVLGMFFIYFITSIFVGTFIITLSHFGALDSFSQRIPAYPILLTLVTSVLFGTAITRITAASFLHPIREVIEATNKLSAGDFSVRLDIRTSPEFEELSESFNRMAEDLGNTELLRTDFVNNFSHEFKTPIVSIKGFAEMLKYEDLTPEERNEYLDIIIAESGRLSTLATNVLNLTKIENQTILSDKKRFNISEQIRNSIVILQQKWEEKKLDVSVEGEDIKLFGNEEFLSQVWINLLDNAIKFAPKGSQIDISIMQEADSFIYKIIDYGPMIDENTRERMFDKFYQGDKSHSTAGNGLGLTLVKRIVNLHDGTIDCDSKEDGTTFIVTLPIHSPEEAN